MMPDAAQRAKDDDRPRLVQRYFSSAPPPDLPALAPGGLFAGAVLVVLAVVVATGFWTFLLLATGAACGFSGWHNFQQYRADRRPADSDMDTLLRNDLIAVVQGAAHSVGQNAGSLNNGECLLCTVAVDLADDGERPPLARTGDDELVRAERYQVFVFWLHGGSVTVWECKLDFRTGDGILLPKHTIPRAGLILSEGWIDLPKAPLDIADPIRDGDFFASMTKEFCVLMSHSNTKIPVKAGAYLDASESRYYQVAWQNAAVLRELHTRVHQ
ncbi:hypothetical protein [Actinocrispum sp. NPDC049592]|uniref:hypothetical protein n=1 Tax=Actinocrispum sp. NPDC049592 TaxID=3154835 RepID=UPI00343F9B14